MVREYFEMFDIKRTIYPQDWIFRWIQEANKDLRPFMERNGHPIYQSFTCNGYNSNEAGCGVWQSSPPALMTNWKFNGILYLREFNPTILDKACFFAKFNGITTFILVTTKGKQQKEMLQMELSNILTCYGHWNTASGILWDSTNCKNIHKKCFTYLLVASQPDKQESIKRNLQNIFHRQKMIAK